MGNLPYISRTIRIFASLILLVLPPGFSAVAEPASASEPLVRARYLMGSRCELRVFAPAPLADRAAEAAFARIAALERTMTTWREDGELARLNGALRAAQAAPRSMQVSEDLYRVLGSALEWAGRTGGRFDPTVGRFSALWDLQGEGRIPADAEIEAVATGGSWRDVRLEPGSRRVVVGRPNVAFDLGGFGKGWALDEAADVLKSHGVTRALLDFGGQVLALEPPPGSEGWIVDIASPIARDEPAVSLVLANASVATSSNRVREFVASGVIGHVLDPRTGRPTGFEGSATVLAPSAAEADALSTAALVGGTSEQANSVPEGAQVLFLTPDETLPGGIALSGSPALLSSLTSMATTIAGNSSTPLANQSGAESSEPVPARRSTKGTEPGVDEGRPAGDDSARIDEIERKLGILAEELDRLRRKEDAASPGVAADEDSARRLGLAPGAAKVYSRERGVSIGGYGEWLYEAFDSRTEAGVESGKQDRADMLRLILYAGYKFSDKIVFNSEIEFEHASTGVEGEVSVELAYIDFLLDERANIRTGLVLVPVGLVNELHEPPTFLGARRPEVETQILPSTWRELGVGVLGDVGPFTYRAYVLTSLDGAGFSAASGIRGGRQKGSKASAEDLGVAARLDLTAVPGLLAGVSMFRGGVDQGALIEGSPFEADVTTLDLHAEWRWRGLELRGVWAEVDVDGAVSLSALTGETIGSQLGGWYLQGGFDVLSVLPSTRHQLIPFVRFESLDTQEEVPAGLESTVTGANDRDLTTWGVVYKPLENIAIKADFQRFETRARTGVDQFNVAVGFYF
jgi:thiamine biosynthesis lipoprotein ApbE